VKRYLNWWKKRYRESGSFRRTTAFSFGFLYAILVLRLNSSYATAPEGDKLLIGILFGVAMILCEGFGEDKT